MEAKHEQSARGQGATPFAQAYFHGTRADLSIGDLVAPGFNSNYGRQQKAAYIFLSATLDAAIWGAELARGDGPERIYVVEPTGPIEDDPDLTDKRFPGNPTQSYRSTAPFRVVGEVTVWQGHPAEQVQAMKAHLAQLAAQGIDSLNDADLAFSCLTACMCAGKGVIMQVRTICLDRWSVEGGKPMRLLFLQ